MERMWRIGFEAVLVAALVLTAGCQQVEDEEETAADRAAPATGVASRSDAPSGVNTTAIAEKLVTATAGVEEGDFVLIEGSPRDLALLEDLAVSVRKAGAFPLITITTDRLQRRMYDDVPPTYDAQEPTADLALVDVMDVFITVDTNEDPAVLEGVPQERIEARATTFQKVMQATRDKGVRFVSVGNGLYPTDESAELQGMSKEALGELFWAGVGADYEQVATRGEAVRGVLEAGSEVHLTNPNGTDLTFSIEGRPVFVSDGVVSAEDRERGGPATSVWLPAGEVFVTPVSGTARGKLVVDRDRFRGKDIRGLELAIEGGKVTSMSAESGLEPFQEVYEASGAGKDEFSYFDIGINPAVRPRDGATLNAFMPAGMVTVGIGNNGWAGGDNESSLGTAYFLPGSTVEVDGRVIVEGGELKI